jgi:hypothetical protein
MNAPSLHFNAFIWPAGYHESAWRMVDDDIRGVLALPYAAPLKSLSGFSALRSYVWVGSCRGMQNAAPCVVS